MTLTRQATQTRRKLYSPKGTLLGEIAYPESWDEYIREGGQVSFHMPQPFSVSAALREPPQEPQFPRHGAIRASLWEYGAVELLGVTPEEFEALRGCSFAPGAGYIRSLLAGL